MSTFDMNTHDMNTHDLNTLETTTNTSAPNYYATYEFWQNQGNQLVLNPRLAPDEASAYQAAWEFACRELRLKAHIGIVASGSSGRRRLVLLSKQAFLDSAQAVNQHLQTTSADCWLVVLPQFHVGGLSILARAVVGGYKAISAVSCASSTPTEWSWNVPEFLSLLNQHKITLTSMVPTQVYDLVREKAKPPQHLRAVVVGGGALSKDLLRQGLALGWPLLPSYGLTECCSQVATAALMRFGPTFEESNFEQLAQGLKVLDHVQLEVDRQGLLKLRSSSLLTAYVYLPVADEPMQIHDPKLDGWFVTEDLAEYSAASGLRPLGRGSEFAKVGGENVSLLYLDQVLQSVFNELSLGYEAAARFAAPQTLVSHIHAHDCVLLAMPDARLGQAIHLLVADAQQTQLLQLVKLFNARVMPYERIRQVHRHHEIPRSALGKVLRAKAMQTISERFQTHV